MSDLIRGGQVTLHKYRMLMQVGKFFFRTSVILLIICFIYSYYRHLDAKDWQIMFTWLKQKMHLKQLYNTFNLSNAFNHTYVYNYEINKVWLKFETTLDKAFTLTAIMMSLVLSGLLLFFWLKGKALKQATKIRGIFITSARKLKAALLKHNHQFKSYRAFELADFPYPITGRVDSWTAGEQSHSMLLGSTGAGKTKIIQNLVYQLHQRKQKAIIVDVKGDYIEHFYRPKRGDIILNPLDIRGRNWSIFKETNPLKGFATIAKSLLPKESKNDPIWIDAARGVFAELSNLYVSDNLSMAQFADKILKSDIATLSKLLQKTGAAKIINKEIEKAALSVLMVLSTYLRPLKLYQSSQDCFSINDWVNDQTQNNFLFISSRSDVKEDINPLITTQVDIAVNALRSLTQTSSIPKIWFILDEMPYFDQAIPSLKDGLAMTRSYGGCFVLGTQDMSSLAKIYSEETTRSIANNCRTKIYMNIAGKETAQWCSQSLGEGEIEEWHEGISYGSHEMRDGIQVNRQRIIRPVVLPAELRLLEAGEGYISFAGFEPAKFKFADCNFKKIAPAYIENTELLKLFKRELEIGENRRREIEAKLQQNLLDDGINLEFNAEINSGASELKDKDKNQTQTQTQNKKLDEEAKNQILESSQLEQEESKKLGSENLGSELEELDPNDIEQNKVEKKSKAKKYSKIIDQEILVDLDI